MLTIVSAVGTAGSFGLSSQVKDLNTLYAVWALIGFFASTMTCLGMRILSDLPNKVRAFGVRQGVELSATAAVLFALPPLVIATYKYPGAALALAGWSPFWVCRLLGTTPPSGTCCATAGGPSQRECACMALPGRVLPLSHRQHRVVGLSRTHRRGDSHRRRTDGDCLCGAETPGRRRRIQRGRGRRPRRAAGALCRGAGRCGRWACLAGRRQGFLSFALGAWIWEFAFTCGCVFQAALIARHDVSGRAVVLIPAVFALGSMVGPGIAGNLVTGGSFASLLLLALACTVVPVLAHSVGRRSAYTGPIARSVP